MELDTHPSSSQADHLSSQASDRRKSGRVSKRPDLFSQTSSSINDAAGGGKRKRGGSDDEDEIEDDENASQSDSDQVNDDDADEEELREKKRAARRAPANKSSVPKAKAKSASNHSAKKPRVGNGIGGQLAIRPAANGKRTTSRVKKPKARPSLAAGETGLYGMYFHTRSSAS